MTTDFSHDEAGKMKPDSEQPKARQLGFLIAHRRLQGVGRIAGRALPGQAARRFAGTLLDRHRPNGRIPVFARQAEERLELSRFEASARFFDHRTMPKKSIARQSGADGFNHPARQGAGGLDRVTAKPAKRVGAVDEAVVTSKPLPDSVVRSLPLRLEEPVQRLMEDMLDMPVPAVKIYTNQAADQVTRQFQADAVACEDRILFRSGRFETATLRGLGLLGHELTHTAQARMQAVGSPNWNTEEGAEQTEAQALTNEQRILHLLSGNPATMPSAGTGGRIIAPQVPTMKSPAVQTAATDRAVTAAEGPMTKSMVQISSGQLAEIKDAVYRDLRERLRTDFERGG